MTVNEKYEQLLTGLYKKTMDRRLAWANNFGNMVSVELASRFIRLSEDKNSDGEPLEVLSIFGADGELIESFTDETFDRNSTPPFGGFGSYWQAMSALRQAAYRQATGADRAIDDILNELGDDTEF